MIAEEAKVERRCNRCRHDEDDGEVRVDFPNREEGIECLNSSANTCFSHYSKGMDALIIPFSGVKDEERGRSHQDDSKLLVV